MKRFLVTYTVLSIVTAEVDAETEDDAYDLCATGGVNETEIDSEFQDEISCEEVK